MNSKIEFQQLVRFRFGNHRQPIERLASAGPCLNGHHLLQRFVDYILVEQHSVTQVLGHVVAYVYRTV